MAACLSVHISIWLSQQEMEGRTSSTDSAERWGPLPQATLIPSPCPPADQATNPLNKELNWASINGFCEQLNEDFEG